MYRVIVCLQINFLDISHLSFVADLGMKGKEGTILKRTGSGAKTRCYFLGLFEFGFCIKCNYLCTSLCGKWHKRHLVVKDTFVAYLNPRDGRIKSVILMDNGFGISLGVYTTGSRSGMQIANLSRHIVIKCWTKRKAKEWMEFIQEVSNNEGKILEGIIYNNMSLCVLCLIDLILMQAKISYKRIHTTRLLHIVHLYPRLGSWTEPIICPLWPMH